MHMYVHNYINTMYVFVIYIVGHYLRHISFTNKKQTRKTDVIVPSRAKVIFFNGHACIFLKDKHVYDDVKMSNNRRVLI